MIKNILGLLKVHEHYGQSEAIEIAKGKHKIPKGFKETLEKHKRKAKMVRNG